MLPTIDFSLIGVVLAIWSVIKVIWGWVCKAFDWITQRALALLIGSKLWATAAFIVTGIVIITAFQTLYDKIFEFTSSLVLSSVEVPSPIANLMSLYIDFSDLRSLCAFIVASWTTYFIVCGTVSGLEKAKFIFSLLAQSWKT